MLTFVLGGLGFGVSSFRVGSNVSMFKVSVFRSFVAGSTWLQELHRLHICTRNCKVGTLKRYKHSKALMFKGSTFWPNQANQPKGCGMVCHVDAER